MYSYPLSLWITTQLQEYQTATAELNMRSTKLFSSLLDRFDIQLNLLHEKEEINLEAMKEITDNTFYYDLLQQNDFDDIFYTSSFTLKKDNTGNIILYPDERFINKKSCVFSHNSIIFEGEMPEMMLIAVQPGIDPKHLHDILQLRIEITADA